VATLPKVLAANTPAGYSIIEAAFAGKAELIHVKTVEEAAGRLVSGVDLVLCGMHFDDSRMFDLLREANRIAPNVPVVCCRLSGSVLTQAALEAMVSASAQLGARDFLDRTVLEEKYGENWKTEFVRIVMAHCG
jgi:DNA-binding NtrC family response regulator